MNCKAWDDGQYTSDNPRSKRLSKLLQSGVISFTTSSPDPNSKRPKKKDIYKELMETNCWEMDKLTRFIHHHEFPEWETEQELEEDDQNERLSQVTPTEEEETEQLDASLNNGPNRWKDAPVRFRFQRSRAPNGAAGSTDVDTNDLEGATAAPLAIDTTADTVATFNDFPLRASSDGAYGRGAGVVRNAYPGPGFSWTPSPPGPPKPYGVLGPSPWMRGGPSGPWMRGGLRGPWMRNPNGFPPRYFNHRGVVNYLPRRYGRPIMGGTTSTSKKLLSPGSDESGYASTISVSPNDDIATIEDLDYETHPLLNPPPLSLEDLPPNALEETDLLVSMANTMCQKVEQTRKLHKKVMIATLMQPDDYEKLREAKTLLKMYKDKDFSDVNYSFSNLIRLEIEVRNSRRNICKIGQETDVIFKEFMKH